jgi:hypothetical protein
MYLQQKWNLSKKIDPKPIILRGCTKPRVVRAKLISQKLNFDFLEFLGPFSLIVDMKVALRG